MPIARSCPDFGGSPMKLTTVSGPESIGSGRHPVGRISSWMPWSFAGRRRHADCRTNCADALLRCTVSRPTSTCFQSRSDFVCSMDRESSGLSLKANVPRVFGPTLPQWPRLMMTISRDKALALGSVFAPTRLWEAPIADRWHDTVKSDAAIKMLLRVIRMERLVGGMRQQSTSRDTPWWHSVARRIMGV